MHIKFTKSIHTFNFKFSQNPSFSDYLQSFHIANYQISSLQVMSYLSIFALIHFYPTHSCC